MEPNRQQAFAVAYLKKGMVFSSVNATKESDKEHSSEDTSDMVALVCIVVVCIEEPASIVLACFSCEKLLAFPPKPRSVSRQMAGASA